MGQRDWFRRTTWEVSDAQAFFERLGRSRSNFHKAQYLRIQAHTLAETGDTGLIQVALDLLMHLFSEFPERSELSAAHLHAAQCHEKLGDANRALEHHVQSLDAQVRYPNLRSGVSIEYPWFVARHNLTHHFHAALQALREADTAFPVFVFKSAATRAFIAQASGDPAAMRYAAEALEAVALEQSQFRYHRTLGLVGKEYTPFITRLQAIATAA